MTPVFFYTRTRGRTRTHARTGGLTLAVIWMALLLGMGFNLMRPAQTSATTDNTINFQARLQSNTGAIVPDGTYNIEFKLYNAPSSSGSSQGSCTGDPACLWTETRQNSGSNGVQVIDGYLTVNLGSVTSFPAINWDQQLYLTMNIGGTSGGASPTYDGEMTPRLTLTALPYAFRAGQLALQTGANESTLGFATQTGARSLLLPDESGTVCTNASGGACSALGFYIQNQNASPQTANFNISGSGTAATSFIAPSFTGTGAVSVASGGTNTNLTLQANGTATASLDTTGAGTVTIGNTNAVTVQVANSAANHTIQIGAGGTGSNVETITIGSVTSTSPLTVASGTSGTTFTPAGGSSNFGVLVKPGSNTTAAFVVQNASSAAALSVDTTNLTTTVQASTDTTTLGSNLITITDCCNAAWTTTGWTMSPVCPGPATSVTNTSTTALTTNQFSPVATSKYDVVFTVSGSPAANSTLTVTLGGQTVGTYTFNGANIASFTENKVLTTINTNVLTFTPSSTFNGTLSAISVFPVTQLPTPVLVVNNASGTANIQVTSSSSTTNTFIGLLSGGANISGINDTGVGSGALQRVTVGNNNSAFGYQALQVTTTGIQNTALGSQALSVNTVGAQNTAVGALVLDANTIGVNNTAVGSQSMTNNTVGSNNTSVGKSSLAANTTGGTNVAVGGSALAANITSSNSTAIGFQALQSSTGGSNTALGKNAGVTSVSGNATVGGTGNTFLGFQAGQGQGVYQSSNSAALGLDAAVNQSNAIILGCTTNAANANGCGTTATVGIGSQYAPSALTVNPSVYGINGTAGTTTTITQTGTTVTGSVSPATSFTSGMAGGTLYYTDGTPTSIVSVNVGAQTMVVGASKTISSGQAFTIVYGGFNVNPAGTTYLQPTSDSATAFEIQNAANSTTVFDVDTTNGRVGIGTNAPGNVLSVGTLSHADSTAQLAVSTGGTGNKGVVIQAVSSQSVDILDVEDSGGNVLFGISSNGHIVTGSPAPTVPTAQAAAGTGAACSISSGNDTSGTITVTTGAGVTTGTWCTFTVSFSATPRPVVSGADQASAALEPFMSSTTNTFTFGVAGGAPSATAYTFNYFNVR